MSKTLDNFQFKTGDVFFVRKETFMSKLIDVFQQLTSKDRKSFYNHVGIVIDDYGSIFETTGTYTKMGHKIQDQYKGIPTTILRWKKMNDVAFLKGFYSIKYLEGTFYPYHRLILQILRLHAKFNSLKLECSTMTAKYSKEIGYLLKEKTHLLYSVDLLWDELESSDEWEIYKLF